VRFFGQKNLRISANPSSERQSHPFQPTLLPTRSGENAVEKVMKAVIGLTFVATLLLNAPASSLAEEIPLELEKLVVTASLEPLAENDVAGSITIIDRAEIEQRQVKYLSDLLRTVPGFAVSQSGGPGTQTQVRVRGSEANHILVLVDGIVVNDPASADEFQFQYALTSNVERIEILRGPQSATWGTGALSAVVNIIQKKSTDEQMLAVDLETGSFDTRFVDVNGSYGSEGYRIWAGASRLQTDGTNISRVGTERDGSENTSINAGVEIQASEVVTINLLGRHVESESDFDDFDFFVTGLPVDADRQTDASRTYWRSEIKVQPDGGMWSGSISVNHIDTDNQNFADGVWTSGTAAETLEFRARASVNIGNDRSGRHRLSFALDQRDVDYQQRGLDSFFGDPNQNQSFDVSGYAVEYFTKPSEVFSWSVSGRLDDFSDFDDATTWQLAASRQLTDSLRLRGSVGTGSKAPTFTERFGFYEGSFIGNPNLKPESSSGWELGFDFSFADNRSELQLVYFDRELEDEIDGFVFDPSSGFFTANNKATPSERSGFELGFETVIGAGLSLKMNYSYTDATEFNFLGMPVREVRRPKNMANLNANYIFMNQRATINLDVNFNGDQLDLFFSPITFLSEQVVLASYTEVNLAGSWRVNENLDFVARLNNLLDEDYEEVLGFARPGRSAYAGIRSRFEF
jgi:vitamin B12 transporter